MNAILRKCATKGRKNVKLVLNFVDKLSSSRAVCGACAWGYATKKMKSCVLVACFAAFVKEMLWIN